MSRVPVYGHISLILFENWFDSLLRFKKILVGICYAMVCLCLCRSM